MVHKGGGGVKNVQKSVHMVYGWPLLVYFTKLGTCLVYTNQYLTFNTKSLVPKLCPVLTRKNLKGSVQTKNHAGIIEHNSPIEKRYGNMIYIIQGHIFTERPCIVYITKVKFGELN